MIVYAAQLAAKLAEAAQRTAELELALLEKEKEHQRKKTELTDGIIALMLQRSNSPSDR